MRRLSAFALHATSAAIMAWGWLNLPLALILPRKGGYLEFLTNQGLLFAWLYMVISLFCDVFPSVVAVRHLKKMLLMMSMPVAFVISIIYWPLLLFLPELITPPTVVERAPLSIDLALHALPLISLLIDFFVFESKFSKMHVYKMAPAALFVFSVWYASFIEYCATFNGSFPYPFLTHSPFTVRVLIYTTSTGVAVGCFRMLNALHV